MSSQRKNSIIQNQTNFQEKIFQKNQQLKEENNNGI